MATGTRAPARRIQDRLFDRRRDREGIQRTVPADHGGRSFTAANHQASEERTTGRRRDSRRQAPLDVWRGGDYPWLWAGVPVLRPRDKSRPIVSARTYFGKRPR